MGKDRLKGKGRKLTMPIDMLLVATFVLYPLFGALMRTIFGVYRAYANFEKFTISWPHVAVEILASMSFGIFGGMILNEIGVWKFGINIVQVLAGFFGADIVSILTKKFGLTKGIEVHVVEGVEFPDLNFRQQRAIEFIKKNGDITNSEYQKINFVSRDSARWDLGVMAARKILKKEGNGKSSYYILSKDIMKK